MDKTGACTVIAAIATRRPAGARHAAAGRRAGRREHARPAFDAARRHRPRAERQDGRHHQHRRRGPPDPGRRDDLGGALGATHLVDVATLTGAVSRALGHLVTGAFGTPQAWCDEVIAAGARAGERYWQIPLVDDYESDMESWYADLKNSGSAEGSLVKSGLFLREFVTKPWVHLDIGGTAYFRKALPYAPRGATGVTPRHAGRACAGRGARRAASRRDRTGPPGREAPAPRPRSAPSASPAWRVGSSPTGSRPAGRRTTRSGSARAADRLAHGRGGVTSARRDCRLLPARFAGDPLGRLALFGVCVRLTLIVVLLATDLDQRLLPDVITLPMIPIALRLRRSRLEPARRQRRCCRRSPRASCVPAVLYARRSCSAPARSASATSSCWSSVGLLTGVDRAVRRVRAGRSSPASCDRAAARRAAGGAEEVHPVRAVPDPRCVLGGPAADSARRGRTRPGRARSTPGQSAADVRAGRPGMMPEAGVVQWCGPQRDGATGGRSRQSRREDARQTEFARSVTSPP